ncbi:MAG: hypothetical protein JNL57_03460 [Bacteroidetes bacterium]|nr:hypothetical protein [Bacteroidota bacterium]
MQHTIAVNGTDVSAVKSTEGLKVVFGAFNRNKDMGSVQRYYYDSLGIMAEQATGGKMAYRLAFQSDTAFMTRNSFSGTLLLNGTSLGAGSTKEDIKKALYNSPNLKLFGENGMRYINRETGTVLSFDIRTDGIHEISFGFLK